MESGVVIRGSSRRLAVTATSSGWREARVRSTLQPSASDTVPIAVAVSKPSRSASTA